MLTVFCLFLASFTLSSCTIARYDAAKLRQNLLKNKPKSMSSLFLEVPYRVILMILAPLARAAWSPTSESSKISVSSGVTPMRLITVL